MIESISRVEPVLAFKFQPFGSVDDKDPLPALHFHFTFTIALEFMGVSTTRVRKQFSEC
jgi:hypothetical protein